MVPNRLRVAASRRAAVALSSLIGLVLVYGACTKVPLTAPSGTVINLIATTNVVALNGSTDIIAVLIEQGQQQAPSNGEGETPTTGPSSGTPVHNGTRVSFTTTLGRIEPAEAKTSAGQVTVKLVADGRSGPAKVTAYSGGASQTLEVLIGAAAAARLSVTASPQALPATGGSTTIIATVEDAQGNPIQGVPVTFSASAGSLGVTSGITDQFGKATTTLATLSEATVTARTAGGEGGLEGSVTVTVEPNATVSISPGPGSITASTPTSFTVSVGSDVIATEVVVNFGDGDKVNLGAISQQTIVQHMYGSPGSYTASATATFANGTTKTASTTVVIGNFDVTAACGGNVPFGATSNFTATVTPSGVSIDSYIWDFGDGTTGTGRTTSHTYQSRGTKVVQLRVVPTKGPTRTASCSLEVM
jgi:adhesin/invasin